jgi:3',5'-cyclic AMP phosphodiesterase CpdA
MTQPKLKPGNGMTRRGALTRLGTASLLALGLGPSCHSSHVDASRRRVRFIVVNDLHHGAPECEPYFAALLQQMRTHEDIEFVLLLGDLADTGKAMDLAAIRDQFQKLGVPFYPVIGNHDYATMTDRRAYEEVFPGRINYWFRHCGWQFVGLDSTQGTDYQNTRIQPGTLNWLDVTLPKLDLDKPTVVFTHFPLGEGVPMRPLNADEVLHHFVAFNLQGVFGGHHHAFTERRFQGAEVVTNRCCSRLRNNHDGTKEKGYWLVTAANGRLAREFVEFPPPKVRSLGSLAPESFAMGLGIAWYGVQALA